MALATNSTPGSIVLSGDLTGSANAPSLRVTGVTPAQYKPANIIVDAKGRIVWAKQANWVEDIEPLIPDASYTEFGKCHVYQTSDTCNPQLTLTNGVLALHMQDATTAAYGKITANATTSNIEIINDGILRVKNATISSKGIMQPGAGLSVTGGVLSMDITSAGDATTSHKGIVQIGSNINVTSGVISVSTATTSTAGVMRVGSGLTSAGGNLSLNAPDATTGSKGVVQIGSNITVSSGVISVAEAGVGVKGVVQPGTGLAVTGGVLSLTATSDATTSSKGVVQIGTNIDVASGTISVATATNSLKGLVTTADSTSITISAGQINTGSNIPRIGTQNTFTKAQPYLSTTGNTPDLNTYNLYVVDGGASLPTVNAATNIQTGDIFDVYTTTSNAGVSTAGYENIAVGGNKTTGSATGLSNTTDTSGYQTVNVGANKTTASATGLTGNVTGYRIANVGGNKTSSSSTGISSSSIWYSFTITDRLGYSVVIPMLGSSISTYGDLCTQIEAATPGGVNGSLELTPVMVSGNLRLAQTSMEVSTDNFTITDGGGGYTPLFASLSGYTSMGSYVPAVFAPTYTGTATINGVARALSFSGASAQTYSTLISTINTQISGYGTASISGGNLRITSNSTGTTSTVSLSGTVWSSLTGYTGLATAVAGTSLVTYTATITIDSVDYPVSADGTTVQTYTSLLSAVNTALGSAGSIAIVNGDLRITSATTGVSSTVSVSTSDTNNIFTSLSGYTGMAAVAGGLLYPTTYGANFKFSNNLTTTPQQHVRCVVSGSTCYCTYI